MKLHYKKMMAPILITILLVLYCLVYFGFLIALTGGVWKYLLSIVPIVLAIVLIAVCRQRIKEIRSGEEDDLSKY